MTSRTKIRMLTRSLPVSLLALGLIASPVLADDDAGIPASTEHEQTDPAPDNGVEASADEHAVEPAASDDATDGEAVADAAVEDDDIERRAEDLLAEYAQELEMLAQGRQAAADYHYDLGRRHMQEGRLVEAIDQLKIAVDYFPNNERYRRALRDAETLQGTSRDSRSTYIDQLADGMQVEQQRLWAEIEQHVERGNRLLEEGSFRQAEQAFDMAATRLDSLPFADPKREPKMREVESLLQITRERRAQQELQDASSASRLSAERARQLREYELRLERERIDMLLRRALQARERRDFDECILICEQILKIHPAEGRASALLVTARRERHAYLRQVTADRWDEEHRMLSRELQESLLPQLELIVYPDDWEEIDRRRRPPTRGLDSDADDAWRQEIRRNLDQQLTLEFHDNDIQDVVNFLRVNTGVNFVLDPEVVVSGMVPPINLQVSEIRLENALDFIMELTGLRYSLQDEAIYISTEEGLRGNIEMRIYDIRDLTLGLTQFPGPELTIPEPGGTGAQLIPEIEDTDPPDIGELMDIIQMVVAPDSWMEPGVGVDEYGGSMVISQTPEVHRQVEDLLSQLRRQRGLQINVKVRFLLIENSMLEEIRIDWADFSGPQVTGDNVVGTVDGQPTAFAPLGANGLPFLFGGYYNQNDAAVGAGRVRTPLGDYASSVRPALGEGDLGGLTANLQIFRDQHGFLGRMLIQAVEKSRRGNVLVQPDLTLFSGQRAHIVRMNQQSYIADYSVVAGQYEPEISILSYGTVLDVEAIASADRRYITLTLRPSHTEVAAWRRYGNSTPRGDFVAGPIEQEEGGGVAFNALLGTDLPLLIPEIEYQTVRTSATIPDGGSLLVAGMNRTSTARAHSGVPFLSHIPFLGRLFSSTGRSEQELKQFIYVEGQILMFDEIEANL